MSTSPYGLDELRAAAAAPATRNPGVSAWSVGMHVAHCCLATISISKALAASAPPVPPLGFNWRRAVILRTGRIPRGRAKAPAAVVAEGEPDAAALASLLDDAVQRIAEVEGLARDRWFEHFALGVLPRDKALRFIDVHHRHHLKLIADIARR